MNASDAANAAQIAYWNETMGPAWVSMQAALDRQLEGLGLAAIEALGPRPGERVLDVGCGCGATTLELARRVGKGGSVTGVDVSAPMLELARRRAADEGFLQANFVEADAQVGALPGADAAFSRFGVMFFADPVAAFANLRGALAGGGRLAFVCWRSLDENPWIAKPGAAAAAVVPTPPAPPPPDAPGPFAFAEKARIASILERAGFAGAEIRPHDAALGWGDLETSVGIALRMGPSAVVARENPDRRDAIADAVREALRPYDGPEGVKLPSGTWIVTALAP